MGPISSLTWAGIASILFLYSVAYGIALVLYRLYFHPLASFPGSVMARSTFLYEFYHTYFREGSYYLRVKDMHKKYGPVVRITPDELHVDDPTFYDTVFVSSYVRKTENYPRASEGTGFEDMIAISKSHDMHRSARGVLNPFFSKAKMKLMEDRILNRVRTMCTKFGVTRGTDKIVNITNAINSLTNDAVSSMIFADPSDYLGASDFNEAYFANLKRGIMSVPIFAVLPWFAKFVLQILTHFQLFLLTFERVFTAPFLKYALEKATGWRVWDDKAQREILRTRLRPNGQGGARHDTTLLGYLARSNTQQALFGRGGFCRLAQLIQQAGTHNVSYTMSTIITHLLLNPTKLQIMRAELAPVFAKTNLPTWRTLEELPYLTAVIKEGLRMAMGAMNRSARVSPYEDLHYGKWILPKGFPVSMSSYWMHNNPNVFHDPEIFMPERWLCGPDELKVMNGFFVPFSRGSRACLAQNFVWMLNYHILAQLFRPGALDMQLCETDESDVIPAHGYLFVMPKISSKGVRVTIH